ncbi:ribonuclease H Rnh1 [Schizosaccharomyces japonicus yFS275]|uniref:Ribonuclease H n=1 Tax=Schizosaccharomyces japonicus (strain yFS275 / FY16936) TaxID=402676 RepID=T0S170_SCHJY|nr:ribonuclease H Rnh1 [Schizosaccharomyces japonicus yFS275]EQC53057.1 ribonuclease H Rnh1 [Schizosaccharomyces japonicus yFS275]
MPPKSVYYAVANGRTPGIYSNWDDAKQQVTGYSSAKYKKFSSYEEAQNFCQQGKQAIYGTSSNSSNCNSYDTHNDHAIRNSVKTFIARKSNPPVLQNKLTGNRSYEYDGYRRAEKFTARKSNPPVFRDDIPGYKAYDHSANGREKRFTARKSGMPESRIGYGNNAIEKSSVHTARKSEPPITTGHLSFIHDPSLRVQLYETENKSSNAYNPHSTTNSTSNSDRTTVYVDGSCLGNGKHGARAGVGIYFPNMPEASLAEPLPGDTHTNNRAELHAFIRAMQVTKGSVDVYSDSRYVKECLENWHRKWIKNGWKSASNKPVENQDLIKTALELKRDRDISIHYVPGHSNVPGNEAADRLARMGAGQL